MAQGTKVNMCEFFITKMDIVSFVTPKHRTLVPAIGLIYILQLGTLDESVFFLCHDPATGQPRRANLTRLSPLGHVQLSTADNYKSGC